MILAMKKYILSKQTSNTYIQYHVSDKLMLAKHLYLNPCQWSLMSLLLLILYGQNQTKLHLNYSRIQFQLFSDIIYEFPLQSCDIHLICE